MVDAAKCPVPQCGQMLANNSTTVRKQHCAEVHGYPTCPLCAKVIKNIRLFEQHLVDPHEVTQCEICEESIIAGTQKQHLISAHSFPMCPICNTEFSRHDKFVLHMKAHTTTPCEFPGCGDLVVSGQEAAHAASKHGYPNCSQCGQRLETDWFNFMRHVAAHTTAPCDFGCGDLVVSGQEAAHAASRHGFPNCPQCGETFERWDKFYIHVKAHTTAPCEFPGCEDIIVSGQEAAHAASKHGFPNCSQCGETFERWDNFMRHVAAHTTSQCTFKGCTAQVVSGTEERHAREAHGFGGECPLCFDLIDTNWSLFYQHVNAHTISKCTYPGCESNLVSGTERLHACDIHGCPICPRCSEVIEGNYENYYAHVRAQACEPPELRPCPYPNCSYQVYTNRPALTKEHFEERHGGLQCEKCGMEKDTYTSMPLFIKHIEKCHNNRRAILCEFCGVKFATPGKLNSHMCVPIENALTAEQAMAEIGSSLRSFPFLIRVTNEFNESMAFCAQLYPSTLHSPHIKHTTRMRELAKRNLGFSKDPTSAEVVSICDAPILLYLAPHEMSLTDKIKFAYRMMSEPPWVLWCVLVERIASMSMDPDAHDIRFLRQLLQRTELPAGVDEKFRDLDTIRGHLNLIIMRADMSQIQMTYESESGTRDFGKLLKMLDRAHKKRNAALVPREMLPQTLPEPAGPALDAMFPVVHASQQELTWEAVLYVFTRDILHRVVTSRLFPLLSSVDSVRRNFLGTNMFLEQKYVTDIQTQLQKLEQSERMLIEAQQGGEKEHRQNIRRFMIASARADVKRRKEQVESSWSEVSDLASSEHELKAREATHIITHLTEPVDTDMSCTHPRRTPTNPSSSSRRVRREGAFIAGAVASKAECDRRRKAEFEELTAGLSRVAQRRKL